MSSPANTSSTSLPSQLYEVATVLQATELAYNADPVNNTKPLFAPKNNVSIDVDFEAQTCSITATLPMNFAIGGSGVTYIAVTDYLV